MINLTHKKTFGDIQVDEKLYILDPKDGVTILEVTVIKSCLHPKSKNRAVWYIEAFMPFRISSIKDEALKEAEKFGTRLKDKFIVEKTLSLTVLINATIPTVIATEAKYITEWIGKGKSGLILPAS